MRIAVLLLAVLPCVAQSTEEKEVVAVVQRLFDAMAAHDEAGLRATMLPEARLYSVRGDSAPSAIALDTWVKGIAGSPSVFLERFTGRPAVTIRGRIAQLWGEYEFLRGGKFSHCGVDTVTLVKVADGWKIAVLAFTMETAGCKPA